MQYLDFKQAQMQFENVIGGFSSKKVENLTEFGNLVFFKQIKNVTDVDIKLSKFFQKNGKNLQEDFRNFEITPKKSQDETLEYKEWEKKI